MIQEKTNSVKMILRYMLCDITRLKPHSISRASIQQNASFSEVGR